MTSKPGHHRRGRLPNRRAAETRELLYDGPAAGANDGETR